MKRRVQTWETNGAQHGGSLITLNVSKKATWRDFCIPEAFSQQNNVGLKKHVPSTKASNNLPH